MAEYYIHVTGENERWDTLATKYYGDCYEIAPIIESNPQIPITPILESNTEVLIPVKTQNTNMENLPIWKQKIQ